MLPHNVSKSHASHKHSHGLLLMFRHLKCLSRSKMSLKFLSSLKRMFAFSRLGSCVKACGKSSRLLWLSSRYRIFVSGRDNLEIHNSTVLSLFDAKYNSVRLTKPKNDDSNILFKLQFSRCSTCKFVFCKNSVLYGIFSLLFAIDNHFKRGTCVKVLLDICCSSLLKRSNTSNPLWPMKDASFSTLRALFDIFNLLATDFFFKF